MKPLARVGDPVKAGNHCHGHDHGPQPAPGQLRSGACKVYIEGRRAVRGGDRGHSPVCCGGVGDIVVRDPAACTVFIEGRPAAVRGSLTTHCGVGLGYVSSGSNKVFRS